MSIIRLLISGRYLATVALLLALAGRGASAQVLDTQYVSALSTGSGCTAVALSCASFQPGASQTMTVQVSGTFSGTLTFETTSDGINWLTTSVVALAGDTLVTSTTAPGQFSTSNVGILQIRLRATSWSSGQARVVFTRGQASALNLGGGGGIAPNDATFIVQTADADLPNAQAIGALSSGILRGAATTGVITSLGDILPSANGGTANAFFTVSGPATSVKTYTFPNASSTVVTLDASQTLTNKTLTAPVISTISNTGTVTLFTATDTVVGKATSDTLTNKTIDAEGTGNVITLPFVISMRPAVCQNATASLGSSTPTSNPAVPTCITGTNTQLASADFADGASTLSFQDHFSLPTDWTGAIDIFGKWRTSATSGAVVWQISTICVADAETVDPSFNTASTVTETAKGTTLQLNDFSISSVTITGCAAGEELFFRFFRDPTNGSDTLAATAQLISLNFTIRRTM